MGYRLTLLGETRVLSVDSVFSLNTIHTPPVSGALGEIGLKQQGQPEKEVHY
jgi:hypothetical protein